MYNNEEMQKRSRKVMKNARKIFSMRGLGNLDACTLKSDDHSTVVLIITTDRAELMRKALAAYVED